MGKKKSKAKAPPAAADTAPIEGALASVSLGGGEGEGEGALRLALLQTLFQIQKMLAEGVPESKSLLEAAGPLPEEERSKFKKAVMALRVSKTVAAVEKALGPAQQTLEAYPLHAPVLAKEAKATMGDDALDDGSHEYPIRRAQSLLLEVLAKDAIASGTVGELEKGLVGVASPQELMQLQRWVAQYKADPEGDATCSFCRNTASGGGEALVRCGGCGSARFCGKECFLLGMQFGGHRRECRGPRDFQEKAAKGADGDVWAPIMNSPVGPRLQALIVQFKGDSAGLAAALEQVKTTDPELYQAVIYGQAADKQRAAGGFDAECAAVLVSRLGALSKDRTGGKEVDRTALRLHLQCAVTLASEERARAAMAGAGAVPVLQALADPALFPVEDAALAMSSLVEIAMYRGNKKPMVEAGLVDWALGKLPLPPAAEGVEGGGESDELRAQLEPALQAGRLLAELCMIHPGMAAVTTSGIPQLVAALSPAVARCQVAADTAFLANVEELPMMIANPVARVLQILAQWPHAAAGLKSAGARAAAVELGAWLNEHPGGDGVFNTAQVLADVTRMVK